VHKEDCRLGNIELQGGERFVLLDRLPNAAAWGTLYRPWDTYPLCTKIALYTDEEWSSGTAPKTYKLFIPHLKTFSHWATLHFASSCIRSSIPGLHHLFASYDFAMFVK